MSLFSAEISTSKPKERVFDLAWMMSALKLDGSHIERIDDVDAPQGKGPRSGTAADATPGSGRR